MTRLLVVDRITERLRSKMYRWACLRTARWAVTAEDRALILSNIASGATREPMLAYYLTCPWCVSVWVGAFVVVTELICGIDVPYPLLLWAASSAVTGFLSSKES